MNRYLHAVYCDDVRQEVGNKISLMGIYGAELFLTEFPAVLPKLVILAVVATAANEPFTRLRFRVALGDELLVESSPDDSLLTERVVPASMSQLMGNDLETLQRLEVLSTVLVMSPLTIKAPTILRIVAETDTGELRCPGLVIAALPQD